MKKNTLFYCLILFSILLISSIAFGQVGINTKDPKGVLDFNSTTLGVVYPNIALIAANNSTPVVNPQGGSIVAGTVIYNTNTTFTGTTNDVYPGIYVWDGIKWIVHYKKRQSELHNQTALLRTESNFAGDWQDIPGLGISDAKTFTAKYSGLYRIELKTNFAGGRTETNNSIFVSQASGQFKFDFDGTLNYFETSAFSAYSSYINSGTYFEAIWKETNETNYVTLIAGQTYNFSLCFDAYDAPGFIGNGSTTTAGDPTSVDLVNEDFQAYADPVPQIFAAGFPDSDCGGGSTTGWETGTEFPCAGCIDSFLTIDSDDGGCSQNATALISFTPTVTTVDISFDYLFRERSGRSDSFRVYIHDGTSQVGADLVYIDNSGSPTTDTSYSGSSTLVAGIAHTLRFEYISNRARYTKVDNVVISELSGPPAPPSDVGRGYVGHEVDCQIEFTYIGE